MNARLVALLMLLIVAGCSQEGLGILRLAPGEQSSLPALDVSATLAKRADVAAALEAYRIGKPDVASGLVNRALQSWPYDADLHYLNGQIYAAWSGIGYPQYRDLAETAYELTLKLDPGNTGAADKLAGLYLDRGAYDDAVLVLARAVNLDDTDARAYRRLAVAAYFDERFAVAKWAADRALALGAARGSPAAADGDFLLVAALATAASGDVTGARTLLSRSAAAHPRSPAQLQSLARAIDAWQAVRQKAAAVPAPSTAASDDRIEDADAAAAAAGSSSGGPVSARWDTCDQPAPSGTSGGYGDDSSDSVTVLGPVSSARFGAPLSVLPSPCADEPLPRMAMIDVVIINAGQLSSRRFGINLLDQLEVVFTGSVGRSIVHGGDEGGTVTTLIGNLALPDAGILYSLNVANAVEERSEVVARPTLVALDRRTSSFVSGNSLFVGVAGTLEGGDLFEIPAGVLLHVAPTFIDNDSMLLAVSASSASFEATSDVLPVEDTSFNDQVAITRNSVQANVMMDVGQTLILSGLVARKVTRSEDKVPLLGDIPGPGSAFNERNSSDAADSVLIILTPRLAQGDPKRPGAKTERSAEAQAFDAQLAGNARASGLDPGFDASLSAALDPTARAMLFQPRIIQSVGASPAVAPGRS
jgi:tetratricopeptide (TPR) repeat protein